MAGVGSSYAAKKMQLRHKLECLLSLAHFALALTVTIPTVAPSSAPAISPSLISLSLEQDLWTDWSGSTSRNEFFFNTLDNLKQITGQPPHIRIGANSEDHTDFNPNVQVGRSSRLVYLHLQTQECTPVVDSSYFPRC